MRVTSLSPASHTELTYGECHSLLRRFTQNQEDVAFMVHALAMLGHAVLAGIDVEAVTRELQAATRRARTRGGSPVGTDTSASVSASLSVTASGLEDASLVGSSEIVRDERSDIASVSGATEASGVVVESLGTMDEAGLSMPALATTSTLQD